MKEKKKVFLIPVYEGLEEEPSFDPASGNLPQWAKGQRQDSSHLVPFVLLPKTDRETDFMIQEKQERPFFSKAASLRFLFSIGGLSLSVFLWKKRKTWQISTKKGRKKTKNSLSFFSKM